MSFFPSIAALPDHWQENFDHNSDDSIEIASFRSLPQNSGSALNTRQTLGLSGLFHNAHL